MIQTRDSVLAIVKEIYALVISEINSEKEYKIVKSSDTDEEELSKNQKNKMSIHSDSIEETSSLYKKYLKKL